MRAGHGRQLSHRDFTPSRFVVVVVVGAAVVVVVVVVVSVTVVVSSVSVVWLLRP